MCITSSGEYAHEKITSATYCNSLTRYWYNNDGQPSKRNKQITRERWRAFRRRMCILRHLRKVSYSQQRKREYNSIRKQKSDGHPSQTNKKSLDNVHDANDQPNCDRANNCDLRVGTIGQDRHTSCPGSRAGAPVCQRANPAVAVIRYSWCRAVGFIRAAVGCVCCWAVMWCVRAGHVAAGVAAIRQMIRSEERVLYQ